MLTGLDMQDHKEVAGGRVAKARFALAAQAKFGVGADAGRNFYGDFAHIFDEPGARTGCAGFVDALPAAFAGRATRREGKEALSVLDLAQPLATGANHRGRAGLGAASLTGITFLAPWDLNDLRGSERGFFEAK